MADYWTRAQDRSNGISMVVFESEEGAQAMASRLNDEGVPGDVVKLESVEVREVVASA